MTVAATYLAGWFIGSDVFCGTKAKNIFWTSSRLKGIVGLCTNIIGNEMTHILYSSGALLGEADQQSVVEQIASMTSKTAEQVKQRLLSGKRKRVKSSDSLSKLIRLEIKLKAVGLDVYIDNR